MTVVGDSRASVLAPIEPAGRTAFAPEPKRGFGNVSAVKAAVAAVAPPLGLRLAGEGPSSNHVVGFQR